MEVDQGGPTNWSLFTFYTIQDLKRLGRNYLFGNLVNSTILATSTRNMSNKRSVIVESYYPIKFSMLSQGVWQLIQIIENHSFYKMV